MILSPNCVNFHLQSSSFSSTTLSFIQMREFRVWRRRRRLKLDKKKLAVSSQLGPLNFPSFENLFPNLISQFASVNSLELIAPALGFASGVALYFNGKKSNRNVEVSDLREWILFTSPTPFNRFVLLRCPSIIFHGSELLEDLNDKLVKEGRHYVNLISGKIQVNVSDGTYGNFEQNLVYQRTCVSTSDGGVISLDWPAKLDLREEHGIDTTVLLVPGTTEGSMDNNIRSFVCELLKRGCFPVVMNPRGCAGSPLTTARLFSAADSDDICTAIQFINSVRPWNTMMAVGWGHGANMLTKYLAEVAERTPLTAATCIDNPFDLEEATRSFPYHVAVDQKLTSGLIDILRSNKEVFQGRAKGFDVEKALSATSLRDFEREISMVSYGFESLEEFYTKSSTRELVGSIKVPLLFIQSDDGTVPPFSIPRSAVAENAFTSLLLCSSLPSTTSENSVLPWCQHFAMEWLQAVELGLLKGRHPLLKDVDVTINPSAGLALVDGRENGGVNKFLNVTEMNSSNGHHVDSSEYQKTDDEGAEPQQSESHEMSEKSGSEGAALVSDSDNAASGSNEAADNEKSQALQSAQVVMNMLDVTTPGTLQEEQKKKVLSAMERGETLMKALEGAVPEDVRGKLTTAVSEIVKNQGTNLNLRGIMNFPLIPNASSEVNSKIQETFKELSSATVIRDDVRSPEPISSGDEMPGGTDKKESGMEKPDHEPESETRPSFDQGHIQSESTGSKEVNESKQNQDQNESSRQKTPESPTPHERRSRADSTPNKHNMTDVADDSVVDELQKNIEANSKVADGNQINEEMKMNVSDHQDMSSSSTKMEETLSPVTSSPDPPLMGEVPNVDEKNMQPMEDQNRADPSKPEEPAPPLAPISDPSFNVSEALDALTGFDDSTQVAVNSVFGVLENMIAKLEEENVQDNGKDGEPISASEESPNSSETENVSENIKKSKSWSLESDQLQRKHPVHNHPDKSAYSHQDERNDTDEKQLTQNDFTSMEGNSDLSSGSGLSNHGDSGKGNMMNDMIDSTLSTKSSDKVGCISKLPLIVSVNPYGDSMYNEYLRRYLFSKIPNTKPLDLNSTADLLLDYFPEEGQWKLLDQTEIVGDPDSDIGVHENMNARVGVIHSPPTDSDKNEIIETSYVILDRGKKQQPIEEYKAEDHLIKKTEEEEPGSEVVVSVENIILHSLKVEVGRRLGFSDMEEMESNLTLDIEHVAKMVSLAVARNNKEPNMSSGNNSALGEVGFLHGEDIVEAISLAVNDSIYLKRVLPVGVIVGSSLAALKNYFSVAAQHDNGYSGSASLDRANNVERKVQGQAKEIQDDLKRVTKKHQYSNNESSVEAIEIPEAVDNNTVMVGAVTAALGASALLAHRQSKDPYNCNDSADVSSGSLGEIGNHPKEHEKNLDVGDDKDQNHVVNSLAEKAMSVAGPVVPTKSDGGLDQERLVAMLSDLGQKGGMLRMIGKLALLWGGIRGAVSLTDRLISFLHIADRPLFQRLLAFACMVLVLWSPVVIPLFPRLVEGWATHNSSGIAEYACVIGLYTAVTILIILWGKRIRGYKDPLEQYGLDLKSKDKLLDFLKGLLGGIMLVVSIHSINALLGCAHFSWSTRFYTSSPQAMTLLKELGRLLILVGRGIVTATVVVIVEEILFRSWLPQEITVDFGYHRAVFVSGFVFSILQRSLRSIPGLWLLSIALSGLRQRSEGSLLIPIGMRAGILSSGFILRTSGTVIYHSSYPLWLAGAHPLQPFDGAVGLAFCIMLAVLFYPKQPLGTKNIQNHISE